jgi:NAD(P)-dependent dehydrogenase (short-subunit alcohol dehydrogenase family)
MTGDLQGKVAIVTGAAQGMGAAVVRRLGAEGATVIATDLADAAPVVAEMPDEAAGRCKAIRLDVADSRAVDAAVDGAMREFGRLDIMVNNAGVYFLGELHELTDDELRKTYEVNVFGTFYGCRAAARVMREQRSGRIVNTASQRGKLAREEESAYSSSKAAIISLTQAAALELGPFGVTVNAVCPGAILTPMLVDGFSKVVRGGRELTADEAIDEYVADAIPMGRIGTPEDMAAMVSWLVSSDASFTTGSALNLTGGERVFF